MPHISPESTVTLFHSREVVRPQSDYDQVFDSIVKEVPVEEESTAEKRALLELLLDERAGDTFAAEVTYLLSIYADRAIVETRPDGTEITRFATRNTQDPENHWIDGYYTITRATPDSPASYTITTLDVPFEGNEVFVSPDGHVEARMVRGTISPNDSGSNIKEENAYRIPIAPTRELYRETLSGMLEKTLGTARIVNARRKADPKAADEANVEGRSMLAAQLGIEL